MLLLRQPEIPLAFLPAIFTLLSHVQFVNKFKSFSEVAFPSHEFPIFPTFFLPIFLFAVCATEITISFGHKNSNKVGVEFFCFFH